MVSNDSLKYVDFIGFPSVELIEDLHIKQSGQNFNCDKEKGKKLCLPDKGQMS